MENGVNLSYCNGIMSMQQFQLWFNAKNDPFSLQRISKWCFVCRSIKFRFSIPFLIRQMRPNYRYDIFSSVRLWCIVLYCVRLKICLLWLCHCLTCIIIHHRKRKPKHRAERITKVFTIHKRRNCKANTISLTLLCTLTRAHTYLAGNAKSEKYNIKNVQT